MMLSHRYRFLFVHIAKKGGASVRRALTRYKYGHSYDLLQVLTSRLSGWTGHRLGCKFPRHARLVAAQQMLPADYFHALFKFTVVRNPWDLQVSSYHHLKREHADRVAHLTDFDAFVRHKFDSGRAPDGLLDVSMERQSDYLKDADGNFVMDFVGRYEQLQADFDHICAQVGLPQRVLPHARRATDRAAYQGYYNAETQEIVAQHYREDIERFAYTF